MDAFATGYLSATLNGADERTSLRCGHLFAARALSTVADQVEPPPFELLDAAGRLDESWWRSADLLRHPYLRDPHVRSSRRPERAEQRAM